MRRLLMGLLVLLSLSLTGTARAQDGPTIVRVDRRSLGFVAGGYLLVLALIVGLQLS
jgi:hypothetical protein